MTALARGRVESSVVPVEMVACDDTPVVAGCPRWRRRVAALATGIAAALLAIVVLVFWRRARRRPSHNRDRSRVVRLAQALAAHERAERTAGSAPLQDQPVAPFVTVKRSNPRVGDTLGHWWLELDGRESYGWWPARCPLPVRQWFRTVPGTLNGASGASFVGCANRDLHHGESADHEFHPVRLTAMSDAAIRAAIRSYAAGYSGGWRARSVWPWSRRASRDCRTFQLELLAVAGLGESPTQLVTRGPGCPALVGLRAVMYLCRAAVRPASIRTVPGFGGAA